MAVNLRKLVDVRVDSGAALQSIHDTVLGGSNIVRQTFDASSSSVSNLDFVIQTPGLGVYMSRRVNLQVDIPLTFTVRTPVDASAGQSLTFGYGSQFGPCAFPGNSMIQSATVQISTSNFTTQVNQTLPLIKRMIKSQMRKKLSEVPTGLSFTHQIDNGSSYRNPVVLAGSEDASGTVGNASSASWKFTAADGATEAAAPSIALGAGGATVVYGVLSINEPLLIQPFSYDDEVPAFINTNMINIRLNLASLTDKFSRVLRFSTAGPAVSPAAGQPNKRYWISDFGYNTVAVNARLASSKIECQFITPPLGSTPPAKTIYPTVYYNPLSTSCKDSIPAGALAMNPISSSVITLNTAPDMLAIYYVPDLPASNDGDSTTTGGAANGLGTGGLCLEDTCLPIERLEISWNNNPSLLATFDKNELWRRTSQNGVQCAQAAYNGSAYDSSYTSGGVSPWYVANGKVATSGSPILLALNKDIPVEPGVAAGVAGVYTLKVTATVRNNLPYAVPTGTLYVVPVTSQYLVLITGATSSVMSTITTESAVFDTPVTGDVQSKNLIVDGSMSGPMVASARAMYGFSRVLEMLSRATGGQETSGAGAYLGMKRHRQM